MCLTVVLGCRSRPSLSAPGGGDQLIRTALKSSLVNNSETMRERKERRGQFRTKVWSNKKEPLFHLSVEVATFE